MCKNPGLDDAPEFGVNFSPEDGSAVVRCIPPLGSVNYVTVERMLPPIISCTVRVDSSLKVRMWEGVASSQPIASTSRSVRVGHVFGRP